MDRKDSADDAQQHGRRSIDRRKSRWSVVLRLLAPEGVVVEGRRCYGVCACVRMEDNDPVTDHATHSASHPLPSSFSSLPVFIPLITALEISFFVYFVISTNAAPSDVTGHLVTSAGSWFIFRPDRRHEIWRFFVYVFVHASWGHLLFNMLVQLLAGVPLEMTHGSTRIFAIYTTGVLAGSLSTSVFDSRSFLVGASAAIYALMASHFANIFLNYTEMELGLLKLAAVCTIAIADIGFSLLDQRSEVDRSMGPPVSYVAHLTGAAAGLTVGLVILRRPKQKTRSSAPIKWTALTIVLLSLLFAIYWNAFALERRP